MVKAWLFLVCAIITEVAGTLTMNASGHTGSLAMYGLMYIFITTSYILLSFALREISIGIAIAIWEGFGTALITGISILFLDEAVSIQKILGIVLAVCGVVLLHFGEASEEVETESKVRVTEAEREKALEGVK